MTRTQQAILVEISDKLTAMTQLQTAVGVIVVGLLVLLLVVKFRRD